MQPLTLRALPLPHALCCLQGRASSGPNSMTDSLSALGQGLGSGGLVSQADLLRIAVRAKQAPPLGPLLEARLAAIRMARPAAAGGNGGAGGAKASSCGQVPVWWEDRDDEEGGDEAAVTATAAAATPAKARVEATLAEAEAAAAAGPAAGAGSSAAAAAAPRPKSGSTTARSSTTPSVPRASASYSRGAVEELSAQLHRLVVLKGGRLGRGAHGVVVAGVLLDQASSARACAVKFLRDEFDVEGSVDEEAEGVGGGEHGAGDGGVGGEGGQAGAAPGADRESANKAGLMLKSGGKARWEADILAQVRGARG